MAAALRSLLEQQLDEMELLQSMFSSPGEFQIDDQSSFEQASHFRNGLVPGIPGRLSYSLHILVDAQQSAPPGASEAQPASPVRGGGCSTAQPKQHAVDVVVKLPHGYV